MRHMQLVAMKMSVNRHEPVKAKYAALIQAAVRHCMAMSDVKGLSSFIQVSALNQIAAIHNKASIEITTETQTKTTHRSRNHAVQFLLSIFAAAEARSGNKSATVILTEFPRGRWSPSQQPVFIPYASKYLQKNLVATPVHLRLWQSSCAGTRRRGSG